MAWLRDLAAVLGLISIAYSAFLLATVVGFFVIGIELIGVSAFVSYILAKPEETEEENGP